jgi:hypothetical protein
MDLKETDWESVDGMHLAQDMDQWRDVVNTVMDFRFPQNVGNFLSNWVTASQEWLVNWLKYNLRGENFCRTWPQQFPVICLNSYSLTLSYKQINEVAFHINKRLVYSETIQSIIYNETLLCK